MGDLQSLRWIRTATHSQKRQEMKRRYDDFGLSRSEFEHLIEEWCFNEKYRAILKRRFLDGVLLEPLAEEFDMSVRQIQNIIYKEGDRVLRHIPFSHA